MDLLVFIVEMTKALAWPIVVVFLFLVLRKQISGLLSELRHLKYKDIEADFGKKIESISIEADKAGLPPVSEKVEIEPEKEYVLPDLRFKQIANSLPRAAIIETWIDIESALRDLARRHKIDANVVTSFLVRALLLGGLLSAADMKILNDLRSLRNTAVHKERLNLTSEDAMAYRNIALRIIEELKKR